MSLNVNLTSQKIVTTKPAETITFEKGNLKVLQIIDFPEQREVQIYVEGLMDPIVPDNLSGDNYDTPAEWTNSDIVAAVKAYITANS